MRWTILVVLVGVCSACAYHNPSAPTRIETPAALTPASIQITAATRADRLLDVTATVLSADGRRVPGVDVAFSANAGGAVSPSRATTDDSGSARTVLTPLSAQTSISASAGGLASAVAIVGAGSVPSPTPTPSPTPPPPPDPSLPPFTVSFAVSGSPNPGVLLFFQPIGPNIISEAWDFGDGVTLTSAGGSVAHAYAAVGTYTATLTARDTAGRSAAFRSAVGIVAAPVAPPPPPPSVIATITCTSARTTFCNATATFGGEAVASDKIYAVTWDWGDGIVTTPAGPLASHTYTQAGTYPLTAAVGVVTADGRVIGTTSTRLVIP